MKPFSVTDYLKDIDAEMHGHRQEIAKHQVRLQQLADMRVLMMSREEDRATMLGQPSPFGTLPDGAVIAVRDPLTYQPAAAAAPALAAPEVNGHPYQRNIDNLLRVDAEEGAKRARKKTSDAKAYQRRKHREKLAMRLEVAKTYGASGGALDALIDAGRKERSDKGELRPAWRGRHRKYMDEVQRFFLDRPSTPVMTREVTKHFGVIGDKVEQQAVYQALYELRKTGFIHQSQQGEPYTLVQQVRP